MCLPFPPNRPSASRPQRAAGTPTDRTTSILHACSDIGSARPVLAVAPENVPPAGVFARLSAGYGWGAALTYEGDIVTWGEGRKYGQQMPPVDGPFTEVTAGTAHGCALRESGRATCWGGGNWDTHIVPQHTRFVSLAAGLEATCGVTVDAAIECWETEVDPDYVPVLELRIPAGNDWVSVSVGYRIACALSADGEIVCFGDDDWGLTDIPELP